jgi:hypothetical protein
LTFPARRVFRIVRVLPGVEALLPGLHQTVPLSPTEIWTKKIKSKQKQNKKYLTTKRKQTKLGYIEAISSNTISVQHSTRDLKCGSELKFQK